MKRTDLMGALKTAQDKGISLEVAKQSLLNAGYDSQDIEDSVQALAKGESPYAKQALKPLPTLPGAKPQTPPAQPGKPAAQPPALPGQKKKTSPMLILAIVFSSIAIAGALGYLLYAMLLS
jgi:hypothetical protein